MSNIDPDIIDPRKPPDGLPPVGPEEDDLVQPDDIREPSREPAIEPDPEEGGGPRPIIRN